MREALAISCEEGLESLWERHQRLHTTLWTGLTALGLEPFVDVAENRLATVNTIKVPPSSPPPPPHTPPCSTPPL